MKKMKNMKLKAVLLSLVAVLTLGLTSCTDETNGDKTIGQPGYLTLNIKTLKTNQTKAIGAAATDYQLINDLNILVFNNAGSLLLNKYYQAGVTPGFSVTGGVTTTSIRVNELPAGAYVVAFANNGSQLVGISTISDLEAKQITTVGDFDANGLHMTGKSDIKTSADGYTYTADVRIAPVESKISVSWTLTGDVLAYYDVTGVYVLNAVNKTTLPLIRYNQYASGTDTWSVGNILPAGYINAISSARTVSSGLAPVSGRDYNFYYTAPADQSVVYLKDEGAALTSPLHYYVGENYSNNSTVPNANSGSILADATANAGTNQNTLVVIKVTPKASGVPAYITAMGPKYYTYEFNKASTAVNSTNLGTGAIGPDATGVGFSVRRKTNYSLAFNLSELGTTNPFQRLRTLNVTVTAEAWDPGNVPAINY